MCSMRGNVLSLRLRDDINNVTNASSKFIYLESLMMIIIQRFPLFYGKIYRFF